MHRPYDFISKTPIITNYYMTTFPRHGQPRVGLYALGDYAQGGGIDSVTAFTDRLSTASEGRARETDNV